MLSSSHKVKRDLLTKMSYIRNTDGGLVVQRNYTYDKLGRPLTRQTLRSGGAMNETFDYNDRSELIHATRTVGDSFDYAYDNIGNRVTAQEVNSGATSDIAYVTNDLNQYTQIDTNGSDFTPEYDADGNQTLIQTETGIWRVTYNVQNRAVRFENESSGTVITCDYDYMGRRVFKKVEKDGVVTSHEHYLYRGYLQIASLDMMEGQNQALINAYVWDPTQPVATRPLAIFYKGVAYYYGWDLTKNITEIFSLSARLQIDYVYTPFGQVRENGIIPQSIRRLAGRLDKSAAFAPKGRTADGAAVSQPIQWSSEYHDAETGLVYYNYRYYNPRDGRWTRRDPVESVLLEAAYVYMKNSPLIDSDYLGKKSPKNTSVEQCNQMAKNYLAEVLRKYKAFQGCNVTIECRCDSSSFAETRGTNIVMKLPKSMRDGSDGFINTINHELVHAYDNCKRGGMYDCKSMIFSEVRASYYGQCAEKGKKDSEYEESRKKCVRKGVMRSMKQNMEALRKAGADMSKWNCLDTLAEDIEAAYEEMKKNPHNPFA